MGRVRWMRLRVEWGGRRGMDLTYVPARDLGALAQVGEERGARANGRGFAWVRRENGRRRRGWRERRGGRTRIFGAFGE